MVDITLTLKIKTLRHRILRIRCKVYSKQETKEAGQEARTGSKPHSQAGVRSPGDQHTAPPLQCAGPLGCPSDVTHALYIHEVDFRISPVSFPNPYFKPTYHQEKISQIKPNLPNSLFPKCCLNYHPSLAPPCFIN